LGRDDGAPSPRRFAGGTVGASRGRGTTPAGHGVEDAVAARENAAGGGVEDRPAAGGAEESAAGAAEGPAENPGATAMVDPMESGLGEGVGAAVGPAVFASARPQKRQ
jgi:hypothetical protein